ncbi:uncharacterized protein LOC128163927 [Crassostrea angulata]|uniref:uncharacterized protein LOC128163927 n=1 Tax=Magallana angulata TaxID=2784310 RepID=UPI0022B14771|nr:uncharacterized protein LOC128163927 [Crassostrea angulata]
MTSLRFSTFIKVAFCVVFLVSIKRVACLTVHRLFDYVEEGGSDVKVTVIKNKTDPKIVWSFYPASKYIKFRNTQTGLEVYAPENNRSDERKRYQLIGFVAGTDKIVAKLRFTVVDNDRKPKRILEIGGPIKFNVNHKKTPYRTEYMISDFTAGIFNDWEFSPLKITFLANQSGSAIMYARPKDDDTVEGTERFVLSLKKISRKLVSHVQSKVVDIIDNDVVGEWSEWLTFSKCQRGIFGDCYMSMLRQCTSAGSGLSVNAHCHGQSLKRTRCAC